MGRVAEIGRQAALPVMQSLAEPLAKFLPLIWTACPAFICALLWLTGFLPTGRGDGAEMRRSLRRAGWLAVVFLHLVCHAVGGILSGAALRH